MGKRRNRADLESGAFCAEQETQAGKLMAGKFGPGVCHFLAVHLPASPSSSRHPACLGVSPLRDHDAHVGFSLGYFTMAH
jgi:hypothetical protein